MLSNKNGSIAPNNIKAPLLALMTPRLRSLFEGTVEPLLEVVRLQEEIAGREDAQETHRRGVGKAKESLAFYKQKAKEEPQVKAWQQQVEQTRQKLEKISGHLNSAIAAASKLRAKLAQVRKRRAVGPALEQLEGPIVEGSAEVADSSDDDGSEDSSDDDDSSSSVGSDEAVGDGDVKPVSAAAARAAPTYASSAASGSPSPAKKKAKGKKKQKPSSFLARFITEHHDPSSHIFGFLGGGTALKGIGATACGLGKTIKGLLPRAKFRQKDSTALPSLAAFPRLLHLGLNCSYYRQSKQWASDLLLLDANERLESLGISGKDRGFATALVAQQWPKLQALEIDPLEPLLDLMTGRSTVVFPRLHSLAVGSLNGATARALQQLLDRGAFPALTALVTRVVGGARDIVIEPATSDDMAQVCAVLGRLPVEGRVIELDDGALRPQVTWAPFAACIVTGCFPHLKRLTISLSNNSATHDTASLLNAVGSGALGLLESLVIESQKDHYHARLDDEGLDMMPNSLPSLRLLRITRCLGVPHAAMAGLSSAAGPNLTKLDVVKHDGAQAAARLIAAEDYCWLSSLRAVAAAHNQDSPELLANAVGRLPALTSLQVTSLSYDELLVRLMAAADNGTLPRPPKLVLHPSAGECHVSNGARLLLVLWLKEQAKKAVAGQAPAVKWEVELVDYQYGRPPYISKVTDKCLAQIKAAWAQVEGN